MPMQKGALKNQHIGEICYPVKCGNCGAHARWSPTKLPKNIAKTARSDDCLRAEAVADGRNRAAKVRKNKAAQIKWLFAPDAKKEEV